MKDEEKHTSTRHISQMSQAQIVAATKRIMATKFSHMELLEIKSYVNGLITASNKEKK